MASKENQSFDISRRDQVSFKHYQILVKLLREDKTEHHTLEVFTSGPQQLLEMRRVFAKTYSMLNFRSVSNVTKNN